MTQRGTCFGYGVYNEDGSRLSVGDTSAFPMFAEVSVELPAPTQADPDATKSVTERVFGFADYWGVFIDPRGRKLIAESGQQLSDIDFKREVFGPQDTSRPARLTMSRNQKSVSKNAPRVINPLTISTRYELASMSKTRFGIRSTSSF